MTLEHKLKNALKSNNETQIHIVFNEIYNEYSKFVYFVILSYIDDLDDAEDLTQDVFISFFNSLNKTNIRNLKYYLLTIAKNKSINHLKKKQIITISSDDESLPETTTENNDKYNQIILKMEHCLTPFETEIILKHVVYDYTFKELGILYNKPLNTIISTYHRAVKKYLKGENQNEKK